MIKINDLTKQYGDFHLHISMEIPCGMITGLIGKNGAGKSTTIKAILGLVKPDAGSVTVFGKEACLLDENDKRLIGTALSDSGFSTWLTAEDVTAILKKMYPDFDEDAFRSRCSEMGLPMKKRIKDFSTGMKAKLRVLVAMSHNARLLIMDEPTAGLDVEARIEILDMLRRFMAEDENRSILITSHISTDLEDFCDDIYMIHNGSMILHEETDAIAERYAVLKIPSEKSDSFDRKHILAEIPEAYGCCCLTDNKQYYLKNDPEVIVESAKIDDLIILLTGGVK